MGIKGKVNTVMKLTEDCIICYLYTRIKKHMTKKMYHLYYRENREKIMNYDGGNEFCPGMDKRESEQS